MPETGVATTGIRSELGLFRIVGCGGPEGVPVGFSAWMERREFAFRLFEAGGAAEVARPEPVLQLLGLGRNWVRFAQWVAGVVEETGFGAKGAAETCG